MSCFSDGGIYSWDCACCRSLSVLSDSEVVPCLCFSAPLRVPVGLESDQSGSSEFFWDFPLVSDAAVDPSLSEKVIDNV